MFHLNMSVNIPLLYDIFKWNILLSSYKQLFILPSFDILEKFIFILFKKSTKFTSLFFICFGI